MVVEVCLLIVACAKWKEQSGNALLTALLVLLPLHFILFFDVGWENSPGGVRGMVSQQSDDSGYQEEMAVMTKPDINFLKPFKSQEPQQPVRYRNRALSCWILWQPGPDGDFDISYEDADRYTESCNSSALSKEKIYDPSRGKRSSGDIVRLGP